MEPNKAQTKALDDIRRARDSLNGAIKRARQVKVGVTLGIRGEMSTPPGVMVRWCNLREPDLKKRYVGEDLS